MMLSNSTGRLSPQFLLRNRYIILGLAGRGGMGCVYKATDTHTNNSLVAIKEMSQANLSAEKLGEAEERFGLESEMLGKLSHPNLPRVLDSFTESGRSYLVMDFIAGKTLLQLLTESADHLLPVEQVLRYAIQLCTVLDYLHNQSPPIIFRDLKPSNVMITEQDEVYLIDFGIARHFTQGKQQDTIPLGSEGFCPPEQFGTGQTSQRSDLYSLGATLHYSLTGKNPRSNKPTLFDFGSVAELNQQVPGDLDKLILWLVATREEQRPQSAAQVRQILLSIEQWTTASTNSTIRKSKTLQLMRMNSSHFYDTKTARAAQSRQWLTQFNILPGRAGNWCTLVLIPFLALIYGQVEAWLFLFALPIVQHIQEVGDHLFQRITQKEESPLWTRILTSRIWTPYFVFIFFLTPLLLLAGSFYLLIEARSPAPFVALCLCLFLLLLVLLLYPHSRPKKAKMSVVPNSLQPRSAHAGKLKKSGAPGIPAIHSRPNPALRFTSTKSLFILTILALAFLALSLFSQSGVQSVLQMLTLNQLLSCALLFLALFSFLRPRGRFAWADHLSMACTIAVYAFLQYSFGLQELTFSGAQVVNNILVGILGGFALTMLLRLRYPFTWGERTLLCVVSCICIGLQYTFGLQEIAHAPLIATLLQTVPVDPLDLVSLNILLAVGPTLLTLCWLFLPSVQRSLRLTRLPLVVLALTAAGLQNFLASSLSLPPLFAQASPLALPVANLLNLAQLLSCLLFFLIILLAIRLLGRFSLLDHGAIFTVSLTCALLQSAAWDKATHLSAQEGKPASLLSSSLATLNQPQFYTAAYNKLLAQGLMGFVICTLCLVSLLCAAHLLRNLVPFHALFLRQQRFWSSTQQFLYRLEHGLLLVVTVTCLLLYWFFGASTMFLRLSLGFFTPGNLMLLILFVAALLALVRVAHPFFGRVERLLVQIDALACALLLLRDPADTSPLQTVQRWHLTFSLPSACISFGLLLTALLSLLWLCRTTTPTRRILLLLFGGALLCTLLQGLGYPFVLTTLLLLVEGILLAFQAGKTV